MSSPYNGGPAFPSSNGVKVGEFAIHGHAGMTLRDYFAGQALVGVLAAATDVPEDVAAQKELVALSAAALSYRLADAMLKERER